MSRRFSVFLCLQPRARAAFCAMAGMLLLQTAAALPRPAAAQSTIRVPVLRYHSVSPDRTDAGPDIVTPALLESDLAWLTRQGYTALFSFELFDAVTKGQPLPEKPVLLTFDDESLTRWPDILPLLEAYDMKAILPVTARRSEQASDVPHLDPADAFVTWDGITALLDSGRVEIANHTYNMHRSSPRNGTRRRMGESHADYYAALVSDIGTAQSLLKEHCGIVPTAFAFPFGDANRDAVAILQEMGFTVLFSGDERPNEVARGPQPVLLLGRFHRPGALSTEKFMRRIGLS